MADSEPIRGGRAFRADAAAVAALVLASAFLAGSRLALRPDMWVDMGWVTGESSNQLYRADEVLKGRMVYRDFPCQYGPLPVLAAGGFAGLFGNTARTAILFHVVARTAALLAFYALLRRSFRPGSALALSLVGGLSSVLPVGLGSWMSNESVPFELLAMLGAMQAYEVPGRRGPSRSLALGLALGFCQWAKFGGGVVVGAAAVVLDLLWLARVGFGPGGFRRWLLGGLAVAGGFAAAEAVLVAFVFLTSPGPVALDSVLPLYVLESYSDAAAGAERYPGYHGLKYFITAQWLPLSALALGLAGLAVDVASRFRRAPAGAFGCYVGLLFYVVGSALYFKHRYLYYQYAWAVVPAGCLTVGRLAVPVRVPVLLSWCAGLLIFLKASFLNGPDPAMQPYRMPNGEEIYVNATDRERLRVFDEVVTRARKGRPGQTVLLVQRWGGLGFHHYFAPDPGLRNPMFGRGSLRPYDERELKEKLGSVAAFILNVRDDFADPLGDSVHDELLREVRRRYATREYDVGGSHPVVVLERRDPE